MKIKKRLKVSAIAAAAVLLVAFISLLLISGFFQSKKYLEPWQKNYYQRFPDARIRLAAHGLLAANNHNMQPWKIRLDKSDSKVFYLYADSSRMTGEVDPYARQMMITQGTFLEYVAVAGEKLGYKTDIKLFPEGSYDENKLKESMNQKPAAKITITQTKPESSKLYDYMFLPDTNRYTYKNEKLSAETLKKLQALSSDKEITIKTYDDPANMKRLGEYGINGAVIESGVKRVMQESDNIFRPNEYQKNKYRYGYSVEGQGTSGLMVHMLQGIVTLFPQMNKGKASADNYINSTKKAVDNTAAYALITSADNSRISQVKSGMLYSRLVLTAHSMGVAMQPLSQVLEEYGEMKAQYDGIHSDYASGGTIQMLMRLGIPTKEVPRSMRRDAMDLVEK
ncbi:MAG TPA: hypothetical protein VHP38_04275 [Ruminiclostridium sp.]|nr:hypothetical protein [Ruminiclostridium sp.]